MKNKGFTLIELLGIVIILAIIAIIAVPAVINTKKNVEEEEYQRFLENIYMATENYVVVHSESCPYLRIPSNICYIKSVDLINAGYVKNNLVIPKTDKIFGGDYAVIIETQNDGTYKFELTEGIPQ